MDIQAITIVSTLVDGSSTKRTYEMCDVLSENGNYRNRYIETLQRCTDSMMEGVTITLKPVMSFEDEWDAAWDGLSDKARWTIAGLMYAGKKITAIKEIRSETKWGLKEAKKMFDSEWMWTKVKEVI